MSSGRAVGLLLGVAADAVLGDPRRGHPVAAFGGLAQRVEKATYRDSRSAGALHTAGLVGTAAFLGLAVQRVVRRSPVAEATVTALTTWSVLGGTSLAVEGTGMARHLDAGELDAARLRLRGLCGRRADGLDGQGLARATVESVAENTSDAVIAPLFWGALAGVPGLVGYRAANTLDAMIGNRSSRYRSFGWAAARLDDLLNLVPARATAALTTACAPVVGGSARESGRIRRRDASAHPSPNAGQVEAAFAGALRIRLGGRTDYGHATESRPVLGEGRTADGGDVTRSVELSRLVGTVGGVLAAVTASVVGRRRR
ncbi:adenosylcobinamide-phosphate synthase [Actinopolyspora xinjiangensis]|uniref:Cobalamin biosynthesis protein CobD n=1 Tax=Actinopolyspora xinjiangensis TaxID=405564 RepID=A0A1H0UEW6_9ACTN|nr:cobalamin biosynthesis protein [Actinopolyspora xinjiangensis]SDP64822.1 adenosylcobinamide-phosphate synthase [Actinopolyspora xinjiangensis]